jgi:hypothetical protein
LSREISRGKIPGNFPGKPPGHFVKVPGPLKNGNFEKKQNTVKPRFYGPPFYGNLDFMEKFLDPNYKKSAEFYPYFMETSILWNFLAPLNSIKSRFYCTSIFEDLEKKSGV